MSIFLEHIMKKTKKTEIKKEVKIKNFRFPAKGGRKACTIKAENLAAAIEIYNAK